jgi:predicted alpha-1,6-mannanase (GH76 family)
MGMGPGAVQPARVDRVSRSGQLSGVAFKYHKFLREAGQPGGGAVRAGKRMGQKIAWMAAAGLALAGGAAKAGALPAEAADILLQAHTKAFVQVRHGRARFKESTDGGKAAFWRQAEEMEMELDAGERTARARQLALFTNLFRGFIADHGADWSQNDFNDDIMWMVIACSRGYLMTGNTEFRDAARANFDLCFARAWSSDLGGGLWWKTNNLSKNACVNGPAAIAAVLLSRACREPAYLAKAENIFRWERANLYDPASGRVSDHLRRNGHKDDTCYSYNQGTFVGAANLLGHTNDAMQAATFTMNHLCRGGLLPAYDETGDGGGFNGICVRWIARFMKDRHAQPVLESWLRRNAEAAWQVRRPSDNLSWGDWHQATPAGLRYAWNCSSSVVILQVVPMATAGP